MQDNNSMMHEYYMGRRGKNIAICTDAFRISPPCHIILFFLMTVENLLTLYPDLYPNLVALTALNNFRVTLMNLRGNRSGIKAIMGMSSQ